MTIHARRRPARHHVSRTPSLTMVAAAIICGAVFVASCRQFGAGRPQSPASRYLTEAPLELYRAKNAAEEVALARSAAPPAISSHAEVLVLGDRGYETAVKGTNGFVCLVERAWDAGFDDPQFWNPKIRSPDCFNAAAARTQLPQFLARAVWVLAGADKHELIERTRSAFANHTFINPDAGAVSYMLSKNGYVSDDAGGPWLPHIMLYVPRGQAAAWGAGAEGSPIIGQNGSEIEPTILMIPVRRWSDGTPAQPPDAALIR